MKPIKYIFFVFFITSFKIGYAQVATTSDFNPVVKKKSIKKMPFKEGQYDISFELTNNENWPMKISIPKIEEDESVSLILALHWAGDQETYKEYGDCLVFPALDTLNGIIVVPSSDYGNWMDPKNEERVIDFIHKAIKFWPIAKNKIIITGYSNGGIASWNYASKYPKLFSAGIPMAGSYVSSKIKVPLYVIHGEEDELFNCDDVQSTIESSVKQGSIINLKIVNKLSHYMACNYVETLKETALESIKK